MGYSDWFIHFCESTGIPESRWGSIWSKLIREVGSTAEDIVADKLWAHSYKIVERHPHGGGYDFYAVKTQYPPTKEWPEQIHIEVKANNARQSRRQLEVEADIIYHGGQYRVERVILPLPFFM